MNGKMKMFMFPLYAAPKGFSTVFAFCLPAAVPLPRAVRG
jgi:hypothetical protein